jgi:hypothetical protein
VHRGGGTLTQEQARHVPLREECSPARTAGRQSCAEHTPTHRATQCDGGTHGTATTAHRHLAEDMFCQPMLMHSVSSAACTKHCRSVTPLPKRTKELRVHSPARFCTSSQAQRSVDRQWTAASGCTALGTYRSWQHRRSQLGVKHDGVYNIRRVRGRRQRKDSRPLQQHRGTAERG